MSGTTIGLYIWQISSKALDLPRLELASDISLVGLITGAVCLFIFIWFYVWSGKKQSNLLAGIAYIVVALNLSMLIAETSLSQSPFVIFWGILAFFAARFGAWGIITASLGPAAASVWLYSNNLFDLPASLILLTAGVVPIVAGLLIMRGSIDNDASTSQKDFKNLSNELSDITSKTEVVINAIGDGVMAINSQGIIHLINPAAQQLTGWNKQDATALNYKSVLKLIDQKNENIADAQDPIQQSLNTNQEVRTNDLTLMTKSGKKNMLSLVASPVGEAGSGVIVVFRDITKEKTEEREQAEFISTASHEMRTPVASIEGYLGLAVNPQTAQIDTRAKEYITKAQDAAKHLGRLFQDLLDVSKADDRRLSNNPKVVDIVPFTGDIVQGMQQQAVQKGLRLIYKPIPSSNTGEKRLAPVYWVNLDNDHIREVLNNLVENAIKYTPKGEIVVDVSGSDEKITVSIQDTGIGIPAEDMPHLFQKFYRVDNKDTREIGGTGLGLYLSRKLVETMGGRIWAESVYGKGSTFYVELPRISSQEADLVRQQAFAPPAASQPQAPLVSDFITTAKTTPAPVAVVNYSVPRGEALSPEQIAAYAARQSDIAKQQTTPLARPNPTPAPRPQTANIPPRRPNLVQ